MHESPPDHAHWQQKVLQAPGSSDSEQGTHHSSEIMSCGSDQITLADLLDRVEPGSPGTSRLTDMGECSLHLFTTLSLKALATLSPRATSIRVERIPLFRQLVRPFVFDARAKLGFRDVGP